MRIPICFVIVCLLQLTACKKKYPECPANFFKKHDDRLTFVNNSSEKITFAISEDYPQDSIVLDRNVPDEQIVNANPGKNIGPNSSGKYRLKACWEERFTQRINSGILRVMVFNIDTIKAYSATEIIQKGLYKNYLFTLDDLRANDWKVVYP